MEYYSATQRIRNYYWMDLTDFMLNDRSQKQIVHTIIFCLHEDDRHARLI